MHRFFLLDRAFQVDEMVDLGEISHQLSVVLRLQPGMQITLLDNSGFEFIAEIIQLDRKVATGKIRFKQLASTEPWTHLTLYQSALKTDKFEWILQKGTELGVSRFVPVIAARCAVRPDAVGLKKRDRWQKIIQEAAEQCGRTRLPILDEPTNFDAAIQEPSDLRLVPWEEAIAHRKRTSIDRVLADYAKDGDGVVNKCSVLIGPEGGLTADEISAAQTIGWQIVTLGNRILRAETAAIASVAILMERLGELG